MHLQTHTQPRVKVISVISGHSASIHCQYNSLHINDIDSTVLRATRHSLSPWGITARPSLPRADGELLCKNLVARGELTLHEEFVELLQGFAYLLICPHISYQEVMFHGFSSMFANKFGICHLEIWEVPDKQWSPQKPSKHLVVKTRLMTLSKSLSKPLNMFESRHRSFAKTSRLAEGFP